MLSSSSALLANVTTGTSFLGGVEIISTSSLFSEKKKKYLYLNMFESRMLSSYNNNKKKNSLNVTLN